MRSEARGPRAVLGHASVVSLESLIGLLSPRLGGAGLAWSPDGSRLLVTKGISEGRGELLSLDIKRGNSPILTTFGDPMDPRWSPTGNEVAVLAAAIEWE